ncbi:MAG: hypothetical protein WB473_16820 [Pedococcus sp.]
MLTGGSLMILSALLPDFVYGQGAHSFHPQLAVILLAVGAVGAGVAATTLLWAPLRNRWFWPVTAVAVAAFVTLSLILDATVDVGASGLGAGTWVGLAGCLTTFASGAVVLPGRRAAPHTAGPSVDAYPPSPTPLAAGVGAGALVASGAAVVATSTVQYVVDRPLLWAWLLPALVGLTAAALTLRPWRGGHVGPALLLGAATAATWGLWDLPRMWNEKGTASLNSGYFLELAGFVGLVAAGAGALVVLRREHGLVLAGIPWRALAPTVTVGLLAAIPFLLVARWNWDQSETGNAVHDVVMALLVALVPMLTTMVRPAAVGRMVLLGWSFGATGTVLDYWRLLRQGDYPLFGTPYALVALAAFVVLALMVRRPVGPAPD